MLLLLLAAEVVFARRSVVYEWENPQVSIRIDTFLKARSPTQQTDVKACVWDIKICGDGTWVYRDPNANCSFPKCWVTLVSEDSSV